MPRVIFKCPYLKGGSERAASHLHNYVRYMATREGAQHMAIGHEQLPATEEQRKMVAQLLREFPLSRGLFEYEDYQTAPTRGNASEFITRALEDNYDQIAKRDNYVSYIASRPRAARRSACPVHRVGCSAGAVPNCGRGGPSPRQRVAPHYLLAPGGRGETGLR